MARPPLPADPPAFRTASRDPYDDGTPPAENQALPADPERLTWGLEANLASCHWPKDAPGGTNEQGQYEVKTLPAGEYLVQYNMWLYEDHRGGAQAVCFRTVDIEAGHVTEVDVQYDGTGVIHGAFSGPRGESWRERNWRVELHDPASPDGTSSRAGTWKFEENGRYEIPGVPAGTYRVVAYCNGPDGTPQEQSETVSLAEGGTATADFVF